MSMRPLTIAKKLATALNVVGNGSYANAVVKTPADGFDGITVCWDGPSEWAILAGSGDSIFARDYGYGIEEDARLRTVYDLARKEGIGMEPATGCQLTVYRD